MYRLKVNSDIAHAYWRKSTRCSAEDSQCVEVAITDQVVAVRDSKDPFSPVLRFTFEEWEAFVSDVKIGSFDVPAATS